MQTTANVGRTKSVHSSGASVKSMQSAQAAQAGPVVRAAAGVQSGVQFATQSGIQPYQPSQPHVLTEDLKAQLAAANQQRRENLYPRLVQALATVEPGGVTQNYSEQRAMSLQQLAAANKARRSRLREAGYLSPATAMA